MPIVAEDMHGNIAAHNHQISRIRFDATTRATHPLHPIGTWPLPSKIEHALRRINSQDSSAGRCERDRKNLRSAPKVDDRSHLKFTGLGSEEVMVRPVRVVDVVDRDESRIVIAYDQRFLTGEVNSGAMSFTLAQDDWAAHVSIERQTISVLFS